VARGERGVVIVTIGATTVARYARRVMPQVDPDAGNGHGAWATSWDERVRNVAATPPNDTARDDGQRPVWRARSDEAYRADRPAGKG